ncbi:glucose 1-dehydrogenase [Kitasatospora sp. NPDC048540]|uniref:SDR family NAD(P)-dependent oxidoreductase n=1 Tax=unclassified Kitasatospora TaxID=2633591 RepID=UPI00068C2F82|nr:glucose 1-dehydrogenase [Kitasatospora sp. MBT63]
MNEHTTHTTTEITTADAGFTGRVVLVTGGTSGIGFATARLLLARGARVVITGRTEERLRRAADRLADVSDGGARLLTVRADAADLSDTERLMDRIRESYGRLDGLFANAGVGVFERLESTTEADFDRLVDVNVKGVFFTVQRALPLLEAAGPGASVVINASWTLHRAMEVAPMYAATKAAVHNLARSLSAGLADRGIRVNSVSPGYIHTEMYDEIITEEAAREATRVAPPLQRVGSSEDVGEAVSFLLSERASYITGQDLAVDGGLVMKVPG